MNFLRSDGSTARISRLAAQVAIAAAAATLLFLAALYVLRTEVEPALRRVSEDENSRYD